MDNGGLWKSKGKKLILLLIGWGIFGVLMIFFIRELPEIYKTLRQARPSWLLAAVVIQVGTYWVGAYIFENLLKFFGHHVPFKVLFRQSFMTSYLNQNIPSWGMAGIAFIIFDMKKYNIPAAKSMTVGIMFYALTFFTFFLVLTASLVDLFFANQLTSIHVLASIFAFLFVVGISLFLVFTFFNRDKFKKILSFILRPVDGIIKRFGARSQNGESARSVLQTEVLSHELQETFRMLPRAGKYMWVATGWSLAAHLLDILSIYFLFLAFNFNASLGIVVGGFVLASVFGFVSFIPSAVGVFETSMSLVYTSLGIPFNVSVLVSLAFRSLAFWLPIPLGVWVYKHIFHSAPPGLAEFKTSNSSQERVQ
ncbi:UPF0104 family protein [Candidatus Parcubacteria bacterium]|nr:MAG: UPF0104 family protein [Candidatus Parcubacteria bacterium]